MPLLPRRNPDLAAGEMAEIDGASFAIVFFDGDREIDVGAVAVHPTMGFKKFQAVVSQKIGVAPHQISTSLVRRKKARASLEVRRRVPIDEASDFGALARERDCFILAALRRSRRDRRGGRGKRGGGGEIEKKIPTSSAVSAPEKTILRRDAPAIGGVLMPESAAGMLGLWDYESQLRNLQRQRDQYLMATSCYPYAAPPVEGFLVGAARRPQPPAECGECRAAAEEGSETAFHLCVYDAVTVGFRSPVGPIQRPPKKAAELEG